MGSSWDARSSGRARNLRALGASAVGTAALALLAGPVGAAGAATTQSFTTAGEYSFVVPAGVSSVSVSAVGGAGGSCNGSAGGEGASAAGTFSVEPGERLLVGVAGTGGTCPDLGQGLAAGGVGGGGTGGGGAFTGAAGGGASEVGPGLLPSYLVGGDQVLIVAAGGGGAGNSSAGGNAGAAGQSGLATTGGAPGTASGGGAGGADLDGTGNGLAGTFGIGGAAGSFGQGGGGGGGGYYGGGGGAGSNAGGTSGGGGGSSFLAADATSTTAATPVTASPSVTITYQSPSEPAATLSTQSLTFARTQPVGSIGPQLTLKVSNSGSAPLVISGVQTGGADPGDFLLRDLCQQPVAPGSSCQLKVRFAPQATGSRTATLTVLSNAPAAAPVTLRGTGAKAGKHPTGNPSPSTSGGQVVCRAGTHGTDVCEMECAPTTYKFHGASVKAAFSVQQGDQVVAHGSIQLTRNTVSRRTLRLRPGKYTLVISTGRGSHKDVLIRVPFRAR